MTTRDDLVARVERKYAAVLDRIDREAEAELPAVLARVEQIRKRARQRAYVARLIERRRIRNDHNQED